MPAAKKQTASKQAQSKSKSAKSRKPSGKTTKKPATKRTTKKTQETYKVEGKKVVGKIKELIKEGNVRRITIKDNKGKTIFVMPVTVGVIGAVLAAPLVVIGAIAAMVTECEISVERSK